MDALATFDEAVELLKKAVKYSTIENQKHIDLSVVNAPERMEYQKALMVVQSAVKRGEITQDELKQKLGLI